MTDETEGRLADIQASVHCIATAMSGLDTCLCYMDVRRGTPIGGLDRAG